MNIEIKLKKGKKLYLETDNNNFILHEGITEHQFEGEKRMIKLNPKYYPTLDYAFHGIFTYFLLNSEAKSLEELSKEIKKIRKLIEGLK